MADNYARQARAPTASTPQFYNAVLLDIDGQLRTHNRSIATHFPSIPRPEYENIQIQYRGSQVNTLMREELNYEAERASAEAERMRATLVARKQASYRYHCVCHRHGWLWRGVSTPIFCERARRNRQNVFLECVACKIPRRQQNRPSACNNGNRSHADAFRMHCALAPKDTPPRRFAQHVRYSAELRPCYLTPNNDCDLRGRNWNAPQARVGGCRSYIPRHIVSTE